ncbi:hypothetical protein [Paenisporosarcina cavernae]|uniref:Uncharacterized protein n=1 Tax=Paenisporosarcina cavernae TaxID=2320858 RepID=A0A385YT51_9BACL|nr:hypothetical protein [Paenisporosarcina cavernae]AYC28643.1 hypothetical protein D3873_01690 [Paenisporosarcina cavernae]
MKREPEDPKREKSSDPKLDNPDAVDTDKESLFDMHEDMQTVDPLPVEELNDKVKDEEDHDHTKDSSSSERKYPD